MTTKVKQSLAQMVYLRRIFSLLWGACKGYTIVWAFLLVIQGLLPVAIVFLSRMIVDTLVNAIGSGSTWQSFQPLLVIGGAMAGIMLLMEILSSILEYIRTAQSEYVQDYVASLIHEKSVDVDLAFYESADYHDRLDRARTDADARSLALLESSGSMLQNGVTLIAMGSLLIPFGWWLPVALLISTAPALFVAVKVNRWYHSWWEQTTPNRRWTKYFDWMLTFSEVAPELRIFGLGDHFKSSYQAVRGKLRGEQLSLAKRQGFARFAAGLLALLVAGAAMAWMVWRALSGAVTLGDLVLFYQAFNRGQGLLKSLLGSIGQIYTNSLFLGNLFEFLDMKPTVLSPADPVAAPSPLKQGISFKNVTFNYPGSETSALDGFDFTVQKGQTVAIVGENGAGKSTVLKLLCRFYDPQQGGIEFDGHDLREMSVDDLRKLITVLFQFPVPYHATVAQNIAMGDLEAELTQEEIEAAAHDSGAHDFISRLPGGYETLLGKWFADGAQLSGGEWQRLALARAFARKAPIIVLDEPTSMMDSWAEIEWMERFRDFTADKTAIIITHRFTTAMRADVIHVMSQGRIVESGTHESLVALNGMYARSWAAQMQAAPEFSEALATTAAFSDGD